MSDEKIEEECCLKFSENASEESNINNTVSTILSEFGIFQIRSVAMLCPVFIFWGMLVQSPVYLNYVPPHVCRKSSFHKNLSAEDVVDADLPITFNSSNNLLYQCHKFTFKDNSNRSTSYPTDTREKDVCSDGFIYNYSLGGNTVSSEFDLICEASWKRPITISTFMLGMMVSSTTGGNLADRFGRKTTVLVAFAIHSILEAIISFVKSYILYVVFLFLMGLVHIIVYIALFVWSQELVQDGSKRSLAALSLNVSFAFGTALLTLLAYFIRDWKWIYRCFSIGSAAYFPILCLVPESPKWLIQKRKDSQAIKLLKKIARVNKIDISETWMKDPQLFKNTAQTIKKKKKTKSKNAIYLFWTNSVLRKRIVIICLLWNISFLGYYTLALNSSNLGGDIYVNNIVGGGVDIVSALFMAAMVNKFGRRNSYAVLIGLSGLFCVLSPSLKSVNNAAGVASAMVGRFFITTSMVLVILYTGELFPTLVRSTSSGIASMSARVGSIVSPFLIFFGEEFDLSIPFYFLGTLCLITPLLTFLLPETSKAVLPDTLEEAIALEKHRFRWIKNLRKQQTVTFAKEKRKKEKLAC